MNVCQLRLYIKYVEAHLQVKHSSTRLVGEPTEEENDASAAPKAS